MTMEIKIAPSLLCGQLLSLGSDVERLTAAGVDRFHHIMDGRFVDNFGLRCESPHGFRFFNSPGRGPFVRSGKTVPAKARLAFPLPKRSRKCFGRITGANLCHRLPPGGVSGREADSNS